MLRRVVPDTLRLATPVAVVFALGLAISCDASRGRVLQAPSTPVATATVLAAPATVAATVSPTPDDASHKQPLSVASPTPAPAPVIQAVRVPLPAERVAVFRDALKRSPWPDGLHAELEEIAACESSLVPAQIGDGGLAYGWLQVRIDYHPALAAAYDLLDGPSNLEAGWLVYQGAGGSFQPWSCWAGR